MADTPWLTIIGLGEDGADGLPPASLAALDAAEIVMGAARHLSLVPQGADRVTWPVPFSDGIETLLRFRGRRVAVLASGDPFWFGAGTVLARTLDPGEWTALPGPSCFALVASRMGWALESTVCLGLHAAPLSRLRPHLAPGVRLIVTLRDGDGPEALAAYLAETGFGDSPLQVMQALGGPRERVSDYVPGASYTHPLCVAIEVAGEGRALPLTPGRADDWFDHDGQITKAPVRAMTLAALAPRPGEHLWDIGGGSGSISLEWLLAHPTLRATCIETNPARSVRIQANAARLGQDRLGVITGTAPEALEGLDPPDAVFVGGGLSADLLARLAGLPQGTRLVVNGVTLEAESLLTKAHTTHGGTLMRLDIAYAAPLGRKRGWRGSFPIVQWSVVL